MKGTTLGKSSTLNREQSRGDEAARPDEAATQPAEHGGLDPSALLDVHRCMLRSRKLDDKEIQLRNQSRTLSRSAAQATRPCKSLPE